MQSYIIYVFFLCGNEWMVYHIGHLGDEKAGRRGEKVSYVCKMSISHYEAYTGL